MGKLTRLGCPMWSVVLSTPTWGFAHPIWANWSPFVVKRALGRPQLDVRFRGVRVTRGGVRSEGGRRDDSKGVGNGGECHIGSEAYIVAIHLKPDRCTRMYTDLGNVVESNQ